MLFPKQMSEVELIVPSKDLVAVTRALSGYGVFHQVDSANLGLEGVGPNTWQEKAGAYSALERRIQTIMQNVGLAEEYPTQPGIDTLVDLDVTRPLVDRIDEDVKRSVTIYQVKKNDLKYWRVSCVSWSRLPRSMWKWGR